MKTNVFADAFQAIFFRVEGNQEYPVNRIMAIGKNLFFLMGTEGIKILFPILLITLVGFLVMVWKLRKKAVELLPLIVTACMPYVWYFVLANHSYIHGFFTYRAQMVTLFSGGTMMILLWEWKKSERP